MLYKLFHKLRKFELTLPVMLGHNKAINLQQEGAVVPKRSSTGSALDKIANFFSHGKESSQLLKLTKRPLGIGIIVILLFFGVFGVWSALAPIDGAVVANGQVISLSNRKIIQHLEGGVIEKIMVKEGEKVEAGQVLIRLKNVSTTSQRAILNEKFHTLKATEERLIVERDSKELVNIKDKRDHNDNQVLLFESRRKNIKGQVGVLQSRIQQGHTQIEGIKSQIDSNEKQIELLMEELEAKRKLLASGNIDRPRVIALEKQLVALKGQKSEYNTNLAKTEQQISSTELEIINTYNKFQNDVVNELKDTQYSIIDVEEKLLAVNDIIARTEIRAPRSGTVTGLQYHTVGGVISPGSKIMEIIPINDDLIIEAKVLPKDIDAVLYAQHNPDNHVMIDDISGNIVKVRLLAFNSRTVAMLNGIMINISADTIMDNRNPSLQYYLAQVQIPKSELKSTSKQHLNLYPGMPVAIFIMTEERTLLSYLLSPIISTIDGAFRER